MRSWQAAHQRRANGCDEIVTRHRGAGGGLKILEN
jgi:hypothetical protein